MDEPTDLEARVSALEGRIEEVAADAAAARHPAAAGDRDLADLGIKQVDANRAAINALGLQLGGRLNGVEGRLTAVEDSVTRVEDRLTRVEGWLDGMDARFDGMDTRFDGMDTRFDGMDARFDGMDTRFDRLEQRVEGGFAEISGRLDATAAGQQTVVDLLTRWITPPEPPSPN